MTALNTPDQEVMFMEWMRGHASALRGHAATDWMWTGEHMSQNHVGITEARAKELQAKHGGVAKPMPSYKEEV